MVVNCCCLMSHQIRVERINYPEPTNLQHSSLDGPELFLSELRPCILTQHLLVLEASAVQEPKRQQTFLACHFNKIIQSSDLLYHPHSKNKTT